MMAIQILGFLEDVVGQEKAASDRPVVVARSEGLPHNLAITELLNPRVRKEAIAFAGQRGVTNARCEMASAPYPVTEDGSPVVDPQKDKIDHYRIDIPISTGL